VVSPRGDRLVVFYSDEVEHEVVGVSEGAGRERLALSFWYLKPPPGRFDPSLMSRS
jgi:Rps23 Pro-64 3,4-dihydroxylase Tpa1-like proline 4-hydroxylase